ncbi:uncharacterized protein SCODWIG_00804 [Saccharomycodes ludwigii]|uniref:CoA-binding domain-containing protein n=1 Tax=Saccharomycodes ludwigii TaxID=36035 RepID=A0A376B2Z0_9ASCO|nr:hypothetical protein SCDLUD_000674 [Saccharomycodes ludwigii]KAH3903063.1 hypothetical protein SCDLUD_000674 [Saccharomycodes ludwigii]SSD59043.1 uncharacterized protein SCODWIG_00804 [Saccharomycodes ludwigii]
MKQNLKAFFSPKTLYFVCGKVYKDTSYANRIVHWFVQHKLPVIPITPSNGIVDLQLDSITKKETKLTHLDIFSSINDALTEVNEQNLIRNFDSISVCFVTRPIITLGILKELPSITSSFKLPINSCWFQPGSWNMDCIKYSEKVLQLGEEKTINDCVLVNGSANYCKSEYGELGLKKLKTQN